MNELVEYAKIRIAYLSDLDDWIPKSLRHQDELIGRAARINELELFLSHYHTSHPDNSRKEGSPCDS